LPRSAAFCAPLPRRGELAAPDSGAIALGVRFSPQVVRRVLAVIERPTLAHDPLVDAFAIDVAHRQQPVVSITGVADALDISAVRVFLLRRGSAARPLLAVGGAGLAQLGRVDAVQPNPFAGGGEGVAINDRSLAGYIGERRPCGESANQQQTGESGMARGIGSVRRRLVPRRGRETRPADATAVEMLDEAGRAYPSRELVTIRVYRPIAAARAEGGIAHQRLGHQTDQVLAINDIHCRMISRERMRNNGDGHRHLAA
jgi:hypothetical protein